MNENTLTVARVGHVGCEAAMSSYRYVSSITFDLATSSLASCCIATLSKHDMYPSIPQSLPFAGRGTTADFAATLPLTTAPQLPSALLVSTTLQLVAAPPPLVLAEPQPPAPPRTSPVPTHAPPRAAPLAADASTLPVAAALAAAALRARIGTNGSVKTSRRRRTLRSPRPGHAVSSSSVALRMLASDPKRVCRVATSFLLSERTGWSASASCASSEPS